MAFECIEAIKRAELIRQLKVVPITLHPRFKRKGKAHRHGSEDPPGTLGEGKGEEKE